MRKAVKYLKALLLLSIGASAVWILMVLFSLWNPRLYGEEVFWNMSTGQLDCHIYIGGFSMLIREESSGTERLFTGNLQTNRPPIIVYSRSLLQPRRGVGSNTRLLSLTKAVCNSVMFNSDTNSRPPVKRWVLEGNIEEFDKYISSW
jgi:hypothetical protein